MVLPLVPLTLIGIGAVTGATGAVFGGRGGHEIKKANDRIRAAGALYDERRRQLEASELETNESLRHLGGCQGDAIVAVVDRMADFLRRNEKQVKHSEKMLVDGLESNPRQVSIDGSLGQDALSWMRGIRGSVVTGAGINSGMTMAVTSVASASTGTAISSLSGVAATNATMAFLGGGSLASGGAGMAAGAAALNFVTIGPAILVTGLVVASQGEKAKTKARENEKTVRVAIEEMELTKNLLAAIRSRTDELADLIHRLVARATAALDALESEPFDAERHADRFTRALALTLAVRDVATAQVVDDTGTLNDDTATFTMTYRTLAKETEDA